MAGHSKWDNIKHRKAAQDSIRSKEFAKFSKEIMVAAKAGGGDINTNSSLKLAVQKAKARSMPSKNIQKAIDKAIGANSDNIDYKETVYEGYLPNGISIMVMCLSDNHNRVSSSVKSSLQSNIKNSRFSIKYISRSVTPESFRLFSISGHTFLW